MKPSVIINNLHKSYGNKTIFTNFSLTVNNSKAIALIGKSGIGKTTLLRCVAGLEPYSGEIKINGTLTKMFQNIRLLPWKTAKKNILLPQKLKKTNLDKKFFDYLVDLLEIKSELNKYPSQMSGGQQQRVALGASLITDPDIILLDEPFNNLNRELAHKILARLVTTLVKQRNKSLLIASHSNWLTDQVDAIIDLNTELSVNSKFLKTSANDDLPGPPYARISF
jgi:ABC-type nitrate/sulfonate/bicarbonate transport system ATPase subunit